MSGAQPTESAIRTHAPAHRFVHFATHGFFAPPQLRSALAAAAGPDRFDDGSLFGRQDVSGFFPDLLSGLVLAGANQPAAPDRDDGILTARELQALDLGDVELATLSACETGLGETAGGEGVLGLQRAFQVAGARTVVASLWQVPDRATQVLMQRYYANLWEKKMTKLDALHEAQLWLLREGRKQPDLLRGLGIDEIRMPLPAVCRRALLGRVCPVAAIGAEPAFSAVGGSNVFTRPTRLAVHSTHTKNWAAIPSLRGDFNDDRCYPKTACPPAYPPSRPATRSGPAIRRPVHAMLSVLPAGRAPRSQHLAGPSFGGSKGRRSPRCKRHVSSRLAMMASRASRRAELSCAPRARPACKAGSPTWTTCGNPALASPRAPGTPYRAQASLP